MYFKARFLAGFFIAKTSKFVQILNLERFLTTTL